MPVYHIPFTYTARGSITVQAESEDQAYDKAQEMVDLSPPTQMPNTIVDWDDDETELT